jgi:hypothetical protein
MTKPADLEQRIRAIELRLRVRRQLVMTRAAVVGRRLRSKATSPPVLIGAAAGGFILFRTLRRLFRRRPARPSSGPSPQTAAKVGLLARIAEIAAITRSLTTSWPGSLLRRSVGGTTEAGPAGPMPRAPVRPAAGHSSGHIYH